MAGRGEKATGPVMLDLRGPVLESEERELLAHPRAGGVLLFARNYRSPAQLRALIRAIRRVRPALIVAVDQEGGPVQRFREGFTALPPLAAIGRWHDRDARAGREAAYRAGRLMARELRRCGVDLSLAPVVDLAGNREVIGERAFHARPEVVAALARAYTAGMATAGMAAVAKHFPGHGGVEGDSHLTLPRDGRSRAAIARRDLVPFRDLARAGIAAVMTAHVSYPEVDEMPASLSARWLRSELRERLGFTGAVLSDDLSMGGVAGFGDAAERAQRAVEAGTDLVLVCNDRAAAVSALDRLGPPAADAVARLARLRGNDGCQPSGGWLATERGDRQLLQVLCAEGA